MAKRRMIKKIMERTVEECLTAFYQHCKAKNLAEETIKTYIRDCEDFKEWIDGSTRISLVTREVVEQYTMELFTRDVTQVYIYSKIRHIKVFLYFCMEREYLSKYKIQLPRVDETLKEPYTEDELRKLLKKPKSNNWVEWRDWAMVNYFLGTGNRLSTALNVKIQDIDFDNCLIKLCKLKNRKQQLIPMSSELSKVLEYYLSLWENEPDDYLFPENEGGQLTRSGAYTTLRKYNSDRGVTKTSIHLYRHTFAKNYILAGGDSMTLKRLLGHSTLQMTNHYVNLYATDLQQNYDKFNPLDNIIHTR